MVCEDCSKSTTGLAAPDAWRAGGRDLTKAGENKLLKRGVRSNPYGNCCKICKMKVQISNASYCTPCAYGRGICAVCGKQVLDTTMYKMSEGGVGLHKTGSKDEAKFKSPEQIAREKAQADLYAYLQQTGQDGKMPTKAALEAAGAVAPGLLPSALLELLAHLKVLEVSLDGTVGAARIGWHYCSRVSFKHARRSVKLQGL